MHYALVDDQRTPASPRLTGTCPACGRAMIAKCGKQRVHHWAHRGMRACDSWWEPETLWHRNWKSKFPSPWQEFIRFDASGEKHIADVHTDHGLTIEFQHSHLAPAERIAREKFYGNMMWVVDGARLKHALPRFRDASHSFRAGPQTGLYTTCFPEEAFPRDWLTCTVPVFFDFENAAGRLEGTTHLTSSLWCLLPGRVSDRAVVLEISRDSFVHWTHDKTNPVPVRKILELVALEQQRLTQLASLRAAQMAMAQRQSWRSRYRRRYPRF